MRIKRSIIRALNNACVGVDTVAYLPAVVRLTRALPRWWSCQLARLSMRLDDRWDTGYWSSETAPAAPTGLCDACRRRAAWLTLGGDEDDPARSDDFLAENPVQLCGWCRLDPAEATHIRNAGDLAAALARARTRSVAWPWERPDRVK